jgi:hypothetical protein
MKTRLTIVLAAGLLSISPLVFVTGCVPPDQTARNIITASNAVLVTAQAQHRASCKADPSQTVCQTINRAGAVQNVAIDALSIYCQFTPQSPASQTCVPVKSALPALQAALTNLSVTTADLKKLIGGGQ